MKTQITLLATSALVLAACAPSNPRLMPPPEVKGAAAQSAPIASKVAFQPKVDILFVIDNSDSMGKHQEKLKANVDKFVAAFEADKRLDFHIGVTSIFDSRRYGQEVKTFWPIGKLYPLQDGKNPAFVDGQIPAVDNGALNFVTRETPNYAAVLGATLKIGVLPLKDKATGADLGPEYEELFSPILPAVTGQNAGFIRPEAHLAIVMLTDADDVSSVSAQKIASDLVLMKKSDKSMVSAYAVIAKGDQCHKDPGNDPAKVAHKRGQPAYVPNKNILEFVRLTNGKTYSLCSDFGSQLTEAGKLIAKESSRDMKIELDQVPEGIPQVRLVGSNQTIDATYDSDRLEITIPASAMENQPADAQIEITYTPVDPSKLGTNRIESKF